MCFLGYAFNNEYSATLVLLELETETGITSVELKISPTPHVQLSQELQPRVQSIAVGSSFDPKELIFRNYLNLLTSSCKIAVRIQYSEGRKGESLQFGWFDPRLNLIATNKLILNETSGVESVVPKLTSPLSPGVWTVIGVFNEQMFYKEKFLILPDSEKDESVPHAVIKDPIEKFVDPNERLELDARSMISKYFTVSESCTVEEVISDIPLCHKTPWSSLFPDTKSIISGVDPKTGNIVEN